MNDTNSTVARRVAQTTTAFKQQQTGHMPKSVTVVLSAEMLAIALRAVSTQVEESQAESTEKCCPAAEVSRTSSHEHLGLTAAGQPTHQRRESLQAAGEVEMTTGSPIPVWILRRWLAAALQSAEMCPAAGVACMRALDDGESHA